MAFNRATKYLLTLLLVAAAAWLGTSARFYREAIVSVFFGIALASVIIIHLRVHPSWQEALPILAGTFFFAAVDFRLLPFNPPIMPLFSFPAPTPSPILSLPPISAN